MATAETAGNNLALDKETTTNGTNSATGTTAAHPEMSHEEAQVARAAARFGYGPLAQVNTAEAQLPAFGGEFQPGLYRSVSERKFGNPAPLGLCGFALTTFVLGCINMGARDITDPSIVIGLAFGYGGLVQLLAGMWYVAPDRSDERDTDRCLQGNGRGKHLWCHRAVVVRRLLALVCHHPHARWIRHRQDARDGRQRQCRHVL
jgi:hypothetical protein